MSSLSRHSLRIGVTIGDPAGIGPEVALKAAAALRGKNITPVIIARFNLLKKLYPELIPKCEVTDLNNIESSSFTDGKIRICNIENGYQIPKPGLGNIQTGLESKSYIDTAITLWKKKIIHAITTGPVNKSLIQKGGFHFTGHTEYIADAIGEKKPYMMMFSRDYRVLLVTTHMPVSEITGKINTGAIYKTILTGFSAVKTIDGNIPKIAIAGLDPHCGDDGAIGNFDETVTRKAVSKAKDEGINIEGPFAADTLFLKDRWKTYDLVIAQYHDQGLIPFKMLCFDTGVNVTLGLSIVRTSVDHGTAFDIAGKGIAKHTSMIHAIKLAYKLAMRRED